MATVHRATLLSFDPATWTAYVLLDGSDAEALVPVGQWVPVSMLVADANVAVILFDPTNYDDAMLIGPYGGTPLPNAVITIGGLNLGSATGAAAGQLKQSTTTQVWGAYTLTAAGSASLAGSNTGDQTITLTGDVTGSGAGSFATAIAAHAVGAADQTQMAANSLKGNNTGGAHDEIDLTVAQAKTLLGLTGQTFVPVATIYLTDTVPTQWNAVTAAVGAYTVDMTAAANGAIIGAKAVAIEFSGNWAAASNASYLWVAANGAAIGALAGTLRAQVAGINSEGFAIVQLNGNKFDIHVAGVQILAASIRLVGYFI